MRQGLRVRKLADRATPGQDGTSRYALAGVAIEGDTPAETRVPTSWVLGAAREGWVELVNPRPVHRPGGPPGMEWAVTHTFVHADALVVKTVAGDVRYRVTHQPDKYADHAAATYPDRVAPFDGDDETPVTDEVYAAGATRVDWFYDLELEA